MSSLQENEIIRGYRVIKTLGTGGMGKVYLVEKDNYSYALKEIMSFENSQEKKLAMKTFKQEIKVLKSINHPAFPAEYDYFQDKNKIYILMEYVKGKSMEELISKAEKPFCEYDVLRWSLQLCEVLFYLHTLKPQPVIYRDLKPSNIIITDENMVRLVDFGVARYYDPRKNSDTIRLGTPGYAAPEQCKKEGQSTPRTDIYALGVLLHQLLTLQDPSKTPFRLPPVKQFNPIIDDQLEWIIKKAISLNQRDRYLDADLFKEEFLDYYNEKYGSYKSPYEGKEALAIDPARLKSTLTGSEKPVHKPLAIISTLFLFMLIGGISYFPSYFSIPFFCYLPVWAIVIFLFVLGRKIEDS